MRLLLIWARSMTLLCVLSGAAFADATVSQPNDPAATMDTRLSLLLGQDNSSFAAVGASRLQEITAEPAQADTAKGDLPKISYTDAFLDSQPVASGDQQWTCLAQAIYFESRGESVKGEFAVAEVIANRVDAPDYPKSICDVVNQGTGRRNACQFTFTCDGHTEVISDKESIHQGGQDRPADPRRRAALADRWRDPFPHRRCAPGMGEPLCRNRGDRCAYLLSRQRPGRLELI